MEKQSKFLSRLSSVKVFVLPHRPMKYTHTHLRLEKYTGAKMWKSSLGTH